MSQLELWLGSVKECSSASVLVCELGLSSVSGSLSALVYESRSL